MQPTFSQQLAFGKIAETQIALWLRRAKGWSILPVYEKEINEGKGPRFFTPDKEIVAPDLLVMKGAQVRWIEAKHKSVFTWYRKSPQDDKWQTGIDAHHFFEYCRIAEETAYPVWLLFLHASDEARPYNGMRPSPTGLYGNNLLSIVSAADIRLDTSQGKELAYWHRSDLIRLATLDEVQAAQAQPVNQAHDALRTIAGQKPQ